MASKPLTSKVKLYGQSLVEFMIALPVLMLLIIGLFELGRYVFYYSSITMAVREGVRFGSSSNEYKNCSGIEAAVLNIGSITGMGSGDISIHYEEVSSGTVLYATCTDLAGASNDGIGFGDRIVVQALVNVQPLVILTNLPAVTLISTAEKSISTGIALP